MLFNRQVFGVVASALALMSSAASSGARLHAQGTIGLAVGQPPTMRVLPSGKIAVPVTLDMSASAGGNLASLATGISWTSTRLTLDSVKAGAFGTLTSNIAGAATGSASLSVSSATGTTATATIATLYFTAASTAGGTRILVGPTAGANQAATSVLSLIRPRGLDVCVGPHGRWGDANGDDVVNIIDAQQVARLSVFLSVANSASAASRGDVTSDGSVNVIDAQQIARFSVGLSASARVNASQLVAPAVASVGITPNSPALAPGGVVQLTGTPRDAGNADVTGCSAVTWTSSDATKATVDADGGMVTGVAAGAATITATSGGATATVTITVATPVGSVVVSPGSAGLFLGATQQFTAAVKDVGGNTLAGRVVTWATSNASVATVNASGLVTAVAAGSATITAASEGKSGTATITVTSTPPDLVPETISAGRDHSCGLTTTGAAYCWGLNTSGQLGNGTLTNRSTPGAVGGGLTFRSISAGVAHTVALTAAGVAYSWGDNSEGEIGDGTATRRTTPVAVVGGLTFQSVDAGQNFTVAVTTSGAGYAWGSNALGQLGNGTLSTRLTPVAITGGVVFHSISAGAAHAVGLSTTGAAYAWGYNPGALGDGTNTQRTTPVPVSGGLSFINVAAGGSFSIGITASGLAYAWGNNSNGQLGDGTVTQRLTPVPVSGGVRFQRVSAGDSHALALTSGGALYAWGGNASGALGDGTVASSLAPVAIAAGGTFTRVSAGGTHSLAFAGGGAYSWGNSQYGQLGNGSTTTRPSIGAIGAPFAAPTVSRVEVTPVGGSASIGGTLQLFQGAFDAVGLPVTGRSFVWSSANSAIATVNAAGLVTGIADGTAVVTATADGVSGSVAVRIGSPVSSISLAPLAATIGLTDTLRMVVTARDASGNVLPGVTTTWRTSAPSVASISLPGTVQALSVGYTTITATVEGKTASTTVRVVNDTRLTFGSRTFTLGRASTVDVPVFLGYAATSTVVVNLSSSDPLKATFATPRLVFSPGVTTLNASLQGLTLGTVTLFARDSASVFAPDSVPATVQITASIKAPEIETSQRFHVMNVGDRYGAEVRLSDPAPPGGLAFTLESSGALRAEPATIVVPAGQLAAEFAIIGVSPSVGAINVRAVSSSTSPVDFALTVHAARFTFLSGNGTTKFTIGRGQQESFGAQATPVSLRTPVPTSFPGAVTFTVGTPTVLGSTTGFVWNTDVNSYFVPVRGLATGQSTLTASAPGWTSETPTVVVTSPKVLFHPTAGLQNPAWYTTSPERQHAFILVDSLNFAHPATDSVRFTVRSSDPSVMRVRNPDGVFVPGGFQAIVHPFFAPGGTAGKAWLYTEAPGYLKDSLQVTVFAPKIDFVGKQPLVPGFEQAGTMASVALPTGSGDATIRFISSDTMVVAVDTLRVVAPYNYGSPTLRVRSAGTATVIASATGYAPDTVVYRTGTGRLFMTPLQYARPIVMPAFAIAQINTAANDSLGNGLGKVLQARTFQFVILDPSIVQIDSGLTTRAQGEYPSFSRSLKAVGAGTTKLIVTSAGLRPDTLAITVTPAPLGATTDPELQAYSSTANSNFGVFIPTVRDIPITVTLTARHPTIATVPTTVTIAAGSTVANIPWTAIAQGADTVDLTAPGYTTARTILHVPRGKIQEIGIGGGLRTTSTLQGNVYLGTRNASPNMWGNTTRPVTLLLTSTDSTVMRPTVAAVRIPQGSQNVLVTVRGVTPGTARLIVTDSAGLYEPDTTVALTVTAPQIYFNAAQVTIGMRQRRSGGCSNGSLCLYVSDSVRNAPVVIAIANSEPRTLSAPTSATIPIGGTFVEVPITGLDTTASVSLIATATGYQQGRTDIDIRRPALSLGLTLSAPVGTRYALTAYLRDSLDQYPRTTTEDVTFTIRSSNPAVVAVDSAQFVMRSGQSYLSVNFALRYVGLGTATITVTDERTGFVRYLPASQAVTVTSAAVNNRVGASESPRPEQQSTPVPLGTGSASP
ncbi:MAG: Ig-like domain-containing protein [Gemmatimonadota bacterium]